MLGEVWKRSADPGLLTSTVHDFPDGGGGQDVPAAEVVGQLAADGHDDGHHQMRQGREYANLQKRRDATQRERSSTLVRMSGSKVKERSRQYVKVFGRCQKLGFSFELRDFCWISLSEGTLE